MSLINTMLNDLEDRKSPPPLATLSYTKRDPVEKKPFPILTVSLTLIGVLLVSALWFFHPLNLFTTQNQPTHTQKLLTPPVKMTPTDNLRWTKAVTISGITAQVKDNITELSFFLDHPALYHLTTDELQNQLIITLDNANLTATLPQIQQFQTAISNLTTMKDGDDLQFILTLPPDATVKMLDLTNTTDHPELTIAIQSPTTFIAVQPEKINAVKTPGLHAILAEQYHTALTAAEHGQYKIAIQQLTEILKADGNYSDVRVSLAALLIDQHNYKLAEAVVNEGLESEPEFVGFIELKARLLAQLGKVKPALALLLSINPEFNENLEYYAFVAALYERNNEDILAVQLYKRLLADHPKNGYWWLGLGISLEKMGQSKYALSAYTKAVEEGRLNSDAALYLQERLRLLQGQAYAHN